jgi:hypothetical protein
MYSMVSLVSKTDFFGKWTSRSVTSLLRHKRHVVKKMTGDHRTHESSLRGARRHKGQIQLHDVAANIKEQLTQGQCCGSGSGAFLTIQIRDRFFRIPDLGSQTHIYMLCE